MLPVNGPSGTLSGIDHQARRLRRLPTRSETIKGITYAIFDAASATFQATYS